MAIRRFSGSSLTAGSKSSKLWDQETSLGTFESIATATSSGSDASITFSAIPQNYTHLQFRCFVRSTVADTDDNLYLELNSDTTSVYSWHRFYGTGATIATQGNSAVSAPTSGIIPGGTATASIFGALIIDILDYTNTSKNRTLRSIGGEDRNGAGYVSYTSIGYYSTTALTSVKLSPGGNFAQYSSIALYGIRGA